MSTMNRLSHPTPTLRGIAIRTRCPTRKRPVNAWSTDWSIEPNAYEEPMLHCKFLCGRCGQFHTASIDVPGGSTYILSI